MASRNPDEAILSALMVFHGIQVPAWYAAISDIVSSNGHDRISAPRFVVAVGGLQRLGLVETLDLHHDDIVRYQGLMVGSGFALSLPRIVDESSRIGYLLTPKGQDLASRLYSA